MNDKQLSALARSVGINFDPAGLGDDGIDTWYGTQYLPSGSLRKLVDAVTSAERAACAEICEAVHVRPIQGAHEEYIAGKEMAIRQAASAIRNRAAL